LEIRERRADKREVLYSQLVFESTAEDPTDRRERRKELRGNINLKRKRGPLSEKNDIMATTCRSRIRVTSPLGTRRILEIRPSNHLQEGTVHTRKKKRLSAIR